MATGYRSCDVPGVIPPVKPSSEIKVKPQILRPKKMAEQISLGCPADGVCMPHVDTNDTKTAIDGVRKRFLTDMPKADQETIEAFIQFVKKWIRQNLIPLSSDTDSTFETWLMKTAYPEWRKHELAAAWKECGGRVNARDFKVKSFIKDEVYPEYKHARGINSRTDVFKCFAGPIFKLIEEKVFALEYFIKKIPVADRPKYIYDRLAKDGAKYFEGDYSTFEAHFTKQIMEAAEFQLYEYMTSELPEGNQWYETMVEVLAGRNFCSYKEFQACVDATRMSGEMCTSLGNGFANLMFLLFLFERAGSKINGLVLEGDDNLISFTGDAPSQDDFKKLGCVIKFQVRTDLRDSCFCGLLFDPDDLVNITDPYKVLASFGWAGKKYTSCGNKRLKALLRCKALSYLHQYPGSPIIQALALYGLRVTRSFDVRSFIEKDRALSMWDREKLRAAIETAKLPVRAVPIKTRILMESHFGVSIPRQLHLEQQLDAASYLAPFQFDVLTFPQCWRLYWTDHVHWQIEPNKGTDLSAVFPSLAPPT